jgi:3-hydroxyisobutyrate dehydrogenase
MRAFEPRETKIGWIGTGVMGRWMCEHLMNAGCSAGVYNRTRAKAQPLLDKGARWADSPRAAAEGADVVFTMVGFPPDVREVVLGPQGTLAGAKPGAVLVDMTTTEPSLAQEIYAKAKEKSVVSVDAPVSGGDVGAREARLAIMVGGDEDVIEALMPLFRTMGQNIGRQGGPGAGQHTKMCNQVVIAGTIIGVCEALLYGYKAGLDLNTMIETISKGAASCWTLSNLGPRIVKGNFDPGFFVEHFIKDMSIALAEAKTMGLSLPGLALVHQLYLAVQAQGHGRKGTHALMLALESLSNIEMSR